MGKVTVSPKDKPWGESVPEKGDRLKGGKMADLLAAQGFEGVRLFNKIPFEDQMSQGVGGN